jgi:hypothetical protein
MATAKSMRRHLSVRRAEINVSASANSYRAGIAMKWEPSPRQGGGNARKSASTDSRHYPQVRGARFAGGGGRFAGMPRITLRIRYLTLKLRALSWLCGGCACHQLTQH